MANGQPQQGQQPNQPPTPEDVEASFRDAIDDLISLLQGVGPLYSDIDELVASLELAKKNDGQLRMIMKQITPVRLLRR